MPELSNDRRLRLRFYAVRQNGAPDWSALIYEADLGHRQMRIRRGVRIDDATVKGRNGKPKQGDAFEDAEISLTLTFNDDHRSVVDGRTAAEKLKALNAVFMAQSNAIGATSDKLIPSVYAIQSRLTDALAIQTVMMKELSPGDNPGSSRIDVEMQLVEYDTAAMRAAYNRRLAGQAFADEEHAALEDTLGQSLTEEDAALMDLYSIDPDDELAIQASYDYEQESGPRDAVSEAAMEGKLAAERLFR